MEDINVEEAIDYYYKIKSNYENKIDKLKRSLSLKGLENKLSMSEKRKLYLEYKPKCINCNRPVGTIFSCKYNGDSDTRILISLCGDRASPCPLNIKINLGTIDSIIDLMKMSEELIKDTKNDVIRAKNDLLFGLITSENAVQIFDKLKQDIRDNSDFLEINLERYTHLIDNKERNEELQNKTKLLNEEIKNIKKNMENYESSDDLQIITDIVNIYANKFYGENGLLKQIRDLKYLIKYVDYNEKTNTYHLIQQKYGIKNIEYEFIEPKVDNFVVGGMVSEKKKKQTEKISNKTLKIKSTKSKTTTVKQKPIMVIEEDEEINTPKITEENIMPTENKEMNTFEENEKNEENDESVDFE